jgi:hypothetical protein
LQILEEYKRDLVDTIIEEAIKVAKHRGASEINERDLALVLGESSATLFFLSCFFPGENTAESCSQLFVVFQRSNSG